MDKEAYWEAVPVLVDAEPRWLLRKHHSDGVKQFRDQHGHFASLHELQVAINHLESDAVRYPAKYPDGLVRGSMDDKT